MLIGSLFLSLISCQKEEEPVLPWTGPFKLFAIDRPICPGMQVQLRLLDESSGEVIDFSEFTFDPIPNGLGEVNGNGLYKAPDFISNPTTLEIKIKWNSNSKVEASYTLVLTANSDLNLIHKIPHQVPFENKFYGLSASNEFLFGSPPIGTGPAKSERFMVKVVGTDGHTKWGYDLGIGQTQFGMFYQDHSLVSGWVLGEGGNPVGISKIYDPNGNDLQKAIQEKMNFRDYYLKQSNELFLSDSKFPFYSNPTQVFKVSSNFEILQMTSINYPLHSFMVDEMGSVIGYYVDEINEKSGVVKVDAAGEEEWNVSLPFRYPFDAKLVRIQDQNYGLVKADCNTLPCITKLIYYEFDENGEWLNPGQTIVSSISLDRLINTQRDKLDEFYIEGDRELFRNILVLEEEVFFVFYASTKNYRAIMIKGTQGSSLEYWWDPVLEGQSPLTHLDLINNDKGLEWKTFCGQAICTFQLDKKLTYNPCF